ncbi:outer membrane biogenesis protein BamB [Bremerella volcania]|uniref:Outer membrane biogenesis protein BamB n=1 Tax=Bremerella volcania TaxID=2527984 RepID=A0A518CBW1_9BACT|nr:PQQ-binding-like beta-propeller repeat protein [Bremerella volcania]QDU76708.1 outer membrane biogenesis protein BamB [Bremerella volcania]
MRLPFYLSFCLTLLSWNTLSADINWPEFRGSDGNGANFSAEVPTDLSDPQNIAWKAEPHGKGWSSPVVWGDQLWITTATEDGKQQYALCYDRNTGEKKFDLLLFENEEVDEAHMTNSYASCTPAIEEGRIYVHFGRYGTACLDTKTGKKLWERRDLPCDHHRGPASSPVIDDKNMYVAFDGFDVQYVVALDKETGKTVWKTDRNIKYNTDNGDWMKAYGTGLLIEHAGRRQLIYPSAYATQSFDPETGDILWSIQHGGMNAAIRPIYRHGLVYVFPGHGKNLLVAVDPSGSGDVTASHVKWSAGKGVPLRPGPVFIEDKIYMLDDDGVVSCRDAKSGDVDWIKRIGGNYRASLVCAGENLYAFTDDGHATVFKASPEEYIEISQADFPSGFQASGVPLDDSLYLRSVKGLYCFRKPKP